MDKSTAVYPIAQAAIVGAGTMGSGIAMAFANAGIPVRLRIPIRLLSTAAWRPYAGITRAPSEKGAFRRCRCTSAWR